MTQHLLMRRLFDADMKLSDQRVLSLRAVPYNETAHVVDELPNGKLDLYTEAFKPGAFTRQAASTEPGVLRKITLRHLHDADYGLGFLGQVSALRESSDGLHADIPILRSRVDDVADLIANGVDCVSIEYVERRGGTQIVDGIRWRTSAHLHAIALEPKGAYTSARVLAYRAAADEMTDDVVTVEEIEQREHDDEEQIAAEQAALEAARLARLEAEGAWLEEQQRKQDELAQRFDVERLPV